MLCYFTSSLSWYFLKNQLIDLFCYLVNQYSIYFISDLISSLLLSFFFYFSSCWVEGLCFACFFFGYIYFLFYFCIHETHTHTHRERERESSHRQREKQDPCREHDAGLDPGTPGSCPEPKADAQCIAAINIGVQVSWFFTASLSLG